MPLLVNPGLTPVRLQLSRNLVRTVKRGHAWVYRDALRSTPQAPPGAPAVLFDNRGGREVARGFYDPDSPIAMRICSTRQGETLDQAWASSRMQRALDLRRGLFSSQTSGYRLFNGEGDGLPGLVCDIYSEHAVVKLDGPAPEGFWDPAGIAIWVAENLPVSHVIQRFRNPGGKPGKALHGELPAGPVAFLENGVSFTADLIHGQKTGFFCDQRDNRALIKSLAAGRSVLNLFGYTGGFSVYAGLGGAVQAATVDTAQSALEAAAQHWALNDLDPAIHQSIHADAFEFLESQTKAKTTWDVVILDPPSFAPSEAAVPAAVSAYTRLICLGAQVTASGGILAAASCSSHISAPKFLEICEEAISNARRRATLLGIYGQPPDHPAPLVMPELRYLKFVLMRVD